jgi:hypothetical protein
MCLHKSIAKPNDLIGYIPWDEYCLNTEQYAMTQEEFDAMAALLTELEAENFFEVPASGE